MSDSDIQVEEPERAAAARRGGVVVGVLAIAVALASARDYAGGWNDGSRLATVESLVDQHTLVIDRSIFVQPPPPESVEPNPYPDDLPALQREGTKDKLFINGHYYSDKSPLPALTLAGLYKALQEAAEIVARRQPDRFCYWMTVGSSGLAYVVAVCCIYQLGGVLGVGLRARLGLTAVFALATVAPVYARHVNNHIMLLGVTAALMLSLARLATEKGAGRTPWQRVAEAGTLAGFGFTLDLGVGPVLTLCTAGLVAFRTRRVAAVLLFALTAAPWVAAHYALNYRIGGTIGPANAVTEYLAWPGSPFTAENMTGSWQHNSIGHFLLYTAAMLVGKHGFLNHNLPLLLAVAGLPLLWRSQLVEKPEIIFSTLFFAGAWLLYAMASNNYSGASCSIRWFVPLLAPGWYLLTVYLRQRPERLTDLYLLGGFGLLLVAVMWPRGPWEGRMPAIDWPASLIVYWPINAAALVAWGWLEVRRRRRRARVEIAGGEATGRQEPTTPS